LLCALAGCGGQQAEQSRQAFAESSQTQREYRNLRARWFAAKTGEHVALASEVRAFVARHPFDDRSRSAGIFLAWVYLERSELGKARELVGAAKKADHPSDYVLITEAAIDTRAGDPERALRLLAPLAGKIVDPDERVVYGEERVRAALGARHFELSVQVMLDWLVQAPADRYDDVRRSVQSLLLRVPSEDLLRALQALALAGESESASADMTTVRSWLKKSIFGALSRRALDTSDASLSRALLPHAPLELRGSSELASLARQAAVGSSAPRIAGRAVGLFLNLGSEEARRRSAALAAGVSRGLDGAQPPVELVVRDDAGTAERTTAELASLAGEGAAILIAGVEQDSAEMAAAFAERAHIPLLLARGVPHEGSESYVFALGASDEDVAQTLGDVLEQRGHRQLVRVGSGGLPCDTPPAFAGRARFPVDDWRKQRIDAVLVLGDTTCARDVALDIQSAHLPALVACGLECAEAVGSKAGPALAARANAFPGSPSGQVRMSFYEALGRDAAALARAALADFPEQRVIEGDQVGELHERARRALEHVEVDLTTSETRGFAGGHVLRRTLGVIDGAPAPGLKGKP
jgi:hypothetical protein